MVHSSYMDEVYQNIANALARDSRIVAAYVIGSTARGEASVESDFDLAVVVPSARSTTQDDVYELIRHVTVPRDLDLSVVDRQSSPLFLFQIVRDGRLVYEASQRERVAFEACVLHAYYDTAHMRAIYARYLPERFPTNTYAH